MHFKDATFFEHDLRVSHWFEYADAVAPASFAYLTHPFLPEIDTYHRHIILIIFIIFIILIVVIILIIHHNNPNNYIQMISRYINKAAFRCLACIETGWCFPPHEWSLPFVGSKNLRNRPVGLSQSPQDGVRCPSKYLPAPAQSHHSLETEAPPKKH